MLIKIKNINTLILIIIILVQLVNNVEAAKKKVKLTPEQQAIKNKMKAERKKKSEEADKQIRHITEEDFQSTVLNDNENLWVVFYGSAKCPFTQKFNPKWLEIQKKFDNNEINGFDNVKITKVECSGNSFNFCVSQKNQYWPELMFYYKGTKRITYEGEDEIEDVINFMVEQKIKIIDGQENKVTTKIPPSTTKSLPIQTAKSIPSKSTKQTNDNPKVDEQGIIINDGKTGEDIVKGKGKNEEVNKQKEDNKDDDMKMYMGEDDDEYNEYDNEDSKENKENNENSEDEQPNIVDTNNDGNSDYNGYYENKPTNQTEKSKSKVLPISIGGVVVGAIVLLCYRTKKHRGGSILESNHGYSRPSQMNYKYSKNDKFIV